MLFNQQAEEAVVGSLFLEPELVKEISIRPEQLYLDRLRVLLSVILVLVDKGKPIDIVSVVEDAGHEKLAKIGGIRYITELAASVPTTANFHFYQKVVKEYYQKRKTIEIANTMKNEVAEGDFQRVLRTSIEQLRKIEDFETDEDGGEIQSGLVEMYQDCENDLGELTGISSGFRSLDQLTCGFQESDLIVIGARPSVGKTAFALNLAMQAAEKDVSLIFSFEMSQKQLLKRIACYTGEVSSVKMRNPRRNFGDEDWNRFNRAMGMISTLEFRIFDKAGMDLRYMYSKVRQMRQEYGEQKRILVVIDYLQLIVGDPRHQHNRQAEISEISRALKHMARECNVVVVALSQLSRAVENRQDKRPMLSDLRESGQIEQDADVIAFLYRDDYYHKETEQKDMIEVILAKQRNGPIGTVQLGFMKEYGKFTDLVW